MDNMQQYTSIVVDKSCRILPFHSMYYDWVTKIDLPDTITTIEDDPINSSITYLYLPASVINFSDKNPFNHLQKIENFEVAFNNPIITSHKGVLYNKNMSKIIMYPRGKKDKTYFAPKSLNIIGYHSFLENIYIESIILANSIEMIELQAFRAAENLKILAIPIGCKIFQYEIEVFAETPITEQNITYYLPLNVCEKTECYSNYSILHYICFYAQSVFLSQ